MSETHRLAELENELQKLDDTMSWFESPDAVPRPLLERRYELRRLLAAATVPTRSRDVGRGAAFAIMPFRKPFDAYYADVIKPAAIDAGFSIARSDEIYSPGAFVQTIWQQLLAADAVIAEMTTANANVLYELGLSHAVAKKVIILTQRIEDVPSDLRHINCIVYDTSEVNWAERTRNAIQRMLLFEPSVPHRPLLDPPASVDNTMLFAEMSGEVRVLEQKLATAGRRVDETAASLRAAREERDALQKSLAARLETTGDGSVVSVSTDGDERLAALRLPGSDATLTFVNVPAGPFVFGIGGSAETVELPSFWITKYSVTNGQYCAFLNAVGNQEEGGALWVDLEGHSPADRCRVGFAGGRFIVEPGYESHPITYVNYYGAAAFCAWLGCELPTVQQWEKAVRGVDGREYPWGAHPPNPNVANYEEDGWRRDVAPIDVALKPEGASPSGVVQGIGNVWHWTRTHFPDRDVQAVRGGSYFDYRLGNREVYRFQVHPDGPDFSQGFLAVKRFLPGRSS